MQLPTITYVMTRRIQRPESRVPFQPLQWRHPATVLAVAGAVDGCHPTTAEDSLDDVAAHHCSRLERHEHRTRIQ